MMGYLTFSAVTMLIGTFTAFEATTIHDNLPGAIVLGAAGAVTFTAGVGALVLKALSPP